MDLEEHHVWGEWTREEKGVGVGLQGPLFQKLSGFAGWNSSVHAELWLLSWPCASSSVKLGGG